MRRPKLEQMIHQLEWRVEGNEMKYGDVLLYPNHHTLVVDGRWEHLTPMMSKLLAYLMARPGQLLSLGTLMRRVWETEYVGDMRTIHVHVSWLRKALGKERRSLIQTVRGVGYRFGGEGEGNG